MINYVLDAKKKGVDISDHLYGLFFEDISQAADGGMNAEMIVNNSFEFAYYSYNPYECESPVEVRNQHTAFWDITGSGLCRVSQDGGMNKNNPTYLYLEVGGAYHLENPGYYKTGDYDRFGMPVEKGETYHFSLFLKKLGFVGCIKAYLIDHDGVVSSVGVIRVPEGDDGSWVKVETSFVANKSTMGRLHIALEGEGKIGVDYLSLLPSTTWGDPEKYRNGKLSPRMVEVLKDCHPSFFRFPGGCVVEGDVSFDNLYKWRNTVGPLEERKQIPNVWQYLQSYGIGFYEYFALCEDLNMAPLPVLHCGLLCQVRMGEQRKTGYQRILPGTEQFQTEVIDNVADLIYFAKGDINSEDENEAHWAKLRADMGHEKPFDLQFIGIGNENWGDVYFENFAACLKGVRAYSYKGKPTDLLERFSITIVTTAGVDHGGSDTNPSWKIINEKYRDMYVDEHVYNSYQWFIDNTNRYDAYPRDGAKVFMGEYGSHELANGRGRFNGDNNLHSALSEAAFLTGCERNSDVVKMTCYAPLFSSTYNTRWIPNLIWFNAKDVMLTPNYYVQQMFASNVGKYTLTDVAPVDKSNAGGIFVGGNRTAFAVSCVSVRDLASGKIIYSHDFKDGPGDWKVYPGCHGGHIENGELIIDETASFNAYYYDAQAFENCEVEISFRRLHGEQSLIVGAGLCDVSKAGSPDNAGYSVSCQYGKERKGCLDVAFEKRVDFMRTASDLMGQDKFLGYSEKGNRMRFTYTQNLFVCQLEKDGTWHEVLRKNIWKVNERIFQSATVGEDGKIYLKVVNVSGKDEELNVSLQNFTEKKKAFVTTLWNEDVTVTNEINAKIGKKMNVTPVSATLPIKKNTLKTVLKNNSVNVFVIE